MLKSEVFLIIRIVLSVIVLLIASITDMRKKKIPNSLTLSAMGIGLIFRTTELIMGIIDWKYYLFGFVGILSLFIIVGFPQKKIMGGGDAKLLMALFLLEHPIKVLLTFLFANLVVGGVLLFKHQIIVRFVIKKKLKKEETESFGYIPMALGFAVAYILLTIINLLKIYI